jgi:hypothetical protein
MDDETAMEPDGTTEPCPHCGAALARDQRYCLECGTPRTYLSGMLLERLQTPSKPTPSLPPAQPPPSSMWQRGNVLPLIAGVGVLLLAMGVGVLIGRSGSSGASAAAAPAQVIVATPTTGAAGTATTTPEAIPTTAAKTPAAKPKAKAAQPSGVGSVPSKPAPPSTLKNLRTKSGNGESFEQKSKNLPDVVETG